MAVKLVVSLVLVACLVVARAQRNVAAADKPFPVQEPAVAATTGLRMERHAPLTGGSTQADALPKLSVLKPKSAVVLSLCAAVERSAGWGASVMLTL
jgi:hypothetical protein